jgi:CRISPR/Cas system CSM-associated protein Csm2 small subunit
MKYNRDECMKKIQDKLLKKIMEITDNQEKNVFTNLHNAIVSYKKDYFAVNRMIALGFIEKEV